MPCCGWLVRYNDFNDDQDEIKSSSSSSVKETGIVSESMNSVRLGRHLRVASIPYDICESGALPPSRCSANFRETRDWQETTNVFKHEKNVSGVSLSGDRDRCVKFTWARFRVKKSDACSNVPSNEKSFNAKSRR